MNRTATAKTDFSVRMRHSGTLTYADAGKLQLRALLSGI